MRFLLACTIWWFSMAEQKCCVFLPERPNTHATDSNQNDCYHSTQNCFKQINNHRFHLFYYTANQLILIQRNPRQRKRNLLHLVPACMATSAAGETETLTVTTQSSWRAFWVVHFLIKVGQCLVGYWSWAYSSLLHIFPISFLSQQNG